MMTVDDRGKGVSQMMTLLKVKVMARPLGHIQITDYKGQGGGRPGDSPAKVVLQKDVLCFFWLFPSRHCKKLEGVNLNEV